MTEEDKNLIEMARQKLDLAFAYIPNEALLKLIHRVRSDERRKCVTACYVKAYEINAMGDTEMLPAKAAELCAVAIAEMP